MPGTVSGSFRRLQSLRPDRHDLCIPDFERRADRALSTVLVGDLGHRLLVSEDGKEVRFSHTDGEVLRPFLESPKRLISRAQMQEALGGGAGESFDRAMDVRVSRLRAKLGQDPKNPRLIETIYGAGYIFIGDVEWR